MKQYKQAKEDLEEITKSTWSTLTDFSSVVLIDTWAEPFHRTIMENKVLDYCATNKLGVQVDYGKSQIWVWGFDEKRHV